MRRTRSFVIGTALVITAFLAACSNGQGAAGVAPSSSAAPSVTAPAPSAPADETPAAPTGKATAAPAETSAPAKRAKAPATSDLSDLKRAGIKSGKSVLIDVADDGVDLFLQVGDGSRVDFTGTTSTDTTMMSLQAAPVAAKNRVVIKPPFFNEDLGAGYCVADTRDGAMTLEKCKVGKESQIWRVALAGDSGQFELHGAYGVIRVDGRTGLQVLAYTG